MSKFQEPELIQTFEIIGSYWVDTFFNHVYNNTKTSIATPSLMSDEFVRQVHAYTIGIKNNSKCYQEVIQQLHRYYAKHTKLTLNYSSFVDEIVRKFILPEQYYKLTTNHKDDIVNSIICDLVTNLSAFVTSPDMLVAIIDSHAASAKATIRQLQDRGNMIMLKKRSELINRFNHKTSSNPDSAVIDELNKTIKKLLEESVLAEQTIADQSEQIKDLKRRDGKFRKLIELLTKNKQTATTELLTPQSDIRAEMVYCESPSKHVPMRETRAELVDDTFAGFDANFDESVADPPPHIEEVYDWSND